MDLIEVFEIIILAITSVFDFAAQLFTAFNLLPFLIGSFTIYTIYRLLIAPLIGGGAGSDSVKRNKTGDDDNG